MEYYFGWWNLENLFDLHDSAERPEWLQRKLDSELSGWNADIMGDFNDEPFNRSITD